MPKSGQADVGSTAVCMGYSIVTTAAKGPRKLESEQKALACLTPLRVLTSYSIKDTSSTQNITDPSKRANYFRGTDSVLKHTQQHNPANIDDTNNQTVEHPFPTCNRHSSFRYSVQSVGFTLAALMLERFMALATHCWQVREANHLCAINNSYTHPPPRTRNGSTGNRHKASQLMSPFLSTDRNKHIPCTTPRTTLREESLVDCIHIADIQWLKRPCSCPCPFAGTACIGMTISNLAHSTSIQRARQAQLSTHVEVAAQKRSDSQAFCVRNCCASKRPRATKSHVSGFSLILQSISQNRSATNSHRLNYVTQEVQPQNQIKLFWPAQSTMHNLVV
eukprot:2806736-Amphidinium_carterae.1